MEKPLDSDSLLPGQRYLVDIGSDLLEGTFVGRVGSWLGPPYSVEVVGQLVFSDVFMDKGGHSPVVGVNPEVFRRAVVVVADDRHRSLSTIEETVERCESWTLEHHRSPRSGDEPGILAAAESLKRLEFQGDLDQAHVDSLSNLTGWAWWEVDDIDLLADYLDQGGSVPVPVDAVYRDRPVGVYVAMLATIYETESIMKTMHEVGQTAPGVAAPSTETTDRLDLIPRWVDVHEGAKAQHQEQIRAIHPGLARDD